MTATKTTKKTTNKAKKPNYTTDELRPTVRYNKRTGVTIIDATAPLYFTINGDDPKNVVCGDPGKCVVAVALKRSQVFAEGFQVGSNITKIYSDGGKKIIRYSTPSKLAHALRTFDKTGQWGLEPGTYILLPLSKSYRRRNRWSEMRHSGGIQSTYRGTPVAPTRHAESVFTIAQRMAA